MKASSPPNELMAAWLRAAESFGATAASDFALQTGVGDRTLSGPVTASNGIPAWLRVMRATKAGGRTWEGPALAAATLGDEIPRPALIGEHEWSGPSGSMFQALLWERLTGRVVSRTPDLSEPVALSGTWWTELRDGLEHLRRTAVPEHRQRSHTPGFIERMPRFIPELESLDLTVPAWETSHCDLHWANLTAEPLAIIDWEGWGQAPVGYDAAVLHTYALPAPETAAKVREVFADVMETEAGRFAQLVISAEVIQASERDGLHARLLPYVRRRVGELLASM
ncbi:phosphotransferase [Nocardiopsis alba]|uniref:phosphotransferase n=1 Tax=Nocardiopsis alba TaxID=53437 RepID=UPI0033CFD755